MDIFAHALWANAGARKLNQVGEKKGRRKFSIAWATFWGIFPDLLAFSWPFALRIFLVLSGSLTVSNFIRHPFFSRSPTGASHTASPGAAKLL